MGLGSEYGPKLSREGGLANQFAANSRGVQGMRWELQAGDYLGFDAEACFRRLTRSRTMAGPAGVWQGWPGV